jgi:hypothetical protein
MHGSNSTLVLANTAADPVDTSSVQNPADLVAAQQAAAASGTRGTDYRWAYLRFLNGNPGRISPDLIARLYDMNRRVPEQHARSVPALSSFTGLAAPPHENVRTAEEKSDVDHYPPMEVPQRFAAVVKQQVSAHCPRLR